MQTRILANAELTRFGLTMPPCHCSGCSEGLLEASRANTTAHLLVLSLLLFSPSATTLTILEHGLSPVTPRLEGSFPARAPPLCREQVATSQLYLQSPLQSDPIRSQDPLPRHPTCCFTDIVPDP